MEENKKERVNDRIKKINQLIYNVQISIGEVKDIEACKLRRLINPDTVDSEWENQNNG